MIRYGWTCTGAHTSTSSDGWAGLSLDHLNPDAFDAFREHVLQPLVGTAREEGNSVKFLLTDSWEMGLVTGRTVSPKSSGNSGATISGPTCR